MDPTDPIDNNKANSVEKINLLGTDLWPMTMQDVITQCDEHIKQKSKLLIGVANVAKVVNARNNSELHESLLEADFVIADGLPLVWLSKICGKALPERVAGIDIMFELLALANTRQYGVYFLGAKPHVVEKVVQLTTVQYPNVRIAGYRDGYFTPEEEMVVAEHIQKSKADILFVAITPPKKEIFLRKYSEMMGVTVCHGVGGSFDVFAGVTKRAPLWMQKSALEWLFRVMQEPKRMWKRYLITNVTFCWLGFLEIFKHRFGKA